MTTPSCSQFQSMLMLLLLLLPVILAGAAEGPMPRPSCRDKCGNISIPFPFGIGSGCFREGLEISCDDSFVPPRAFLADTKIHQTLYWSFADTGTNHDSTLPLEVFSVSVAESEALVYGEILSDCSLNSTTRNYTEWTTRFVNTSFALSAARNVLIGVGWKVEPHLWIRSDPNLHEDKVVCLTDHPLNRVNIESATNGSCTEQGCCERVFSAKNSPLREFTLLIIGNANSVWDTHPCTYAMLVEKSWYNFSTLDLDGSMVLANNHPRGVPYVLDFAIGNASCPAEGQPRPSDYLCVSSNSSCANAKVGYGYVCKCLPGYAGNPYLPNGCQDIDECKLPGSCSSGVCKNRPGGYDCPCKVGMKGDGKAGTCTDMFPLAAKFVVGTIGGILFMVVMACIILVRKEKRKTREFYKKNGGPTLEKANIIKLFKREELKPILKINNLIGKGGFGEVYKGHLDNKLVAIKKPINGSVLENEQFANEVIIQSQVIHKNIVRLVGCCLEVDTPMLVYEFISQGSLHDILHNKNTKVALNLDTRLNIAAQSADGLAYMHSKANITILHGDVKPANILLDDNFVAKISDFGISRLLARDKEHTASVIGDMNYMDPIYLQEGLLTEKSDVYSFGVVILELITGRRSIHSDNNSLIKSFLEAYKKQEKVTELFDKEIAMAEDLDLLDSLADMAMECLSLDVEQRPSMTVVAERLLILSRTREV